MSLALAYVYANIQANSALNRLAFVLGCCLTSKSELIIELALSDNQA